MYLGDLMEKAESGQFLVLPFYYKIRRQQSRKPWKKQVFQRRP